MTTPAAPAAVAALRDIREQWGDLCAAIDQPPAAEWPPRELHHTLYAVDPDAPAVGRLPLTLREHPAPLNLGALAAAMEIERALFHVADVIAQVVQRTVRRIPAPTGKSGRNPRYVVTTDRNDPDRWHYQAATSPGSRALGLHWCAVWIEQRITATEATDLHGVLDHLVAESLMDDIAAAHRVMQRALGRDGRDTVLPARCPWCGGELTAHTPGLDSASTVITCGTGPTCTAPAPYDREARRVWRGADLCGLYGALSAAQRRVAG